jgi:two-component system response regulator HydG
MACEIYKNKLTKNEYLMYIKCMTGKKDLTNEDWHFFETAARAAFSNPFGETRQDLDLTLGGVSPATSSEEVLGAVISRIQQRVDKIKGKGSIDLEAYDEAKREILRSVFLFLVFHRYADKFDELIHAQLKNGNQPCPVSFSHHVLTDLRSFGFTDEEALRYFGVFYQLRRAYFFISNGLVGKAPSMKVLRKHLWNCVFTHDMRLFEAQLWDRMEDFSILLLGETGSGKGSAASAIGRSGFIPFNPDKNCFTESFTQNFVSINLSQYSEGVLESELFGHKKGAFTGAVENHDGLFSRCAPHGVIFLDEIGDIAIPVQIKLLQVLQERIFFPVGSHEAKRFSGRIIAATNRQLDDLRSEGKFRNDLYFRLCSDEIVIPTLKQRLKEDPSEIDILLTSILSRISSDPQSKEFARIKDILLHDVGEDYSWPGNVRELEQAVKRIILTGHYDVKERLSAKQKVDPLVAGLHDFIFDAEELLSEYCASIYDKFGTYEEVARITKLDRRTAKKYVQAVKV